MGGDVEEARERGLCVRRRLDGDGVEVGGGWWWQWVGEGDLWKGTRSFVDRDGGFLLQVRFLMCTRVF